MKTKLILDFDSTIVDSQKAYCTLYNEMFADHPEFKPADYKKTRLWNLGDECPLSISISREMFGKKEFFDKLEFFPDADRVIRKLTNKYDVAICSIGTFDNIKWKTDWINKNMPYIEKSILLCNQTVKMDKSMVDMSGAIFIDDNKSALDSSNAPVKLLYGETFPWNEGWTGIVVKSWRAIETLLV